MKNFSRTVAFFLVIGLAALVQAQVLLGGKFQRVRERTIDIVHYRADLSFDFIERKIQGTATITLRPLITCQFFDLDAIRLHIEQVDLHLLQGTHPLTFDQSDSGLKINLGRSYSRQETLTVAIRYWAQPNAGLYFLKDHDHPGQYFIYSYGEGGLHANWLPIYNEVNDKFSSEFMVTVPANYSVISNGDLVETTTQSDGQRTFHWKQKLPHSNYLMALYIGEFERGELTPAFGTIPLNFWVPKGRLNEGAYAFRNTPKMVEFFSERFNYRYPWEKYDQVAFPDYAIGAMEHTSVSGHRLSVLRDSSAPDNFGPPDFDRYFQVWSADGLISHELAHHWFGNNITCRNLNYIWLNESFATYCNMLWDEFHLGKDAFDLVRREALDRYLNYVAKKHQIRPLEYAYYDTPSEVYIIEITYFKGALVLHMLREILGDDAFFTTLSYFLHQHQF
ncbi:MAG: M1 family metallopeptidase, partial [candidate division KSB1 bacterium]|nr:M1 family metallopeptidase [candidate division KSB1 bacterium]